MSSVPTNSAPRSPTASGTSARPIAASSSTSAKHLFTGVLSAWKWQDLESGEETWTDWSSDVEDILRATNVRWRIETVRPPARHAEKMAQFEAVKRWFEDDWTRIEPKLRTSIIEGISVFFSLFDDNPRVKHTFCPPKETYDPARNPNGIHGTPLPPLADLVEHGRRQTVYRRHTTSQVLEVSGCSRAYGTFSLHNLAT